MLSARCMPWVPVRCMNCGACVLICPNLARTIIVVNGKIGPFIEREDCDGCTMCKIACDKNKEDTKG